MFILTLVLISCLKVSGSQVCDVRGEIYSPGAFINKCRKCYCNSDGSWNCNPQCPAESISCPSGQKVTRVRKEVLHNCFCDKLVCTPDNNQALVCNVRGELYSPGPFINKCRKCNCNSDGSWNCNPQCPAESISCPSGQKVTRVRKEVLHNCFCDKLVCTPDNNQALVCNVRGELYSPGPFINKCRKCNCNSDGSWKCDPQCPAETISCPTGQKITHIREEVLKGCFCNKLACITDQNIIKGCRLDETTYPYGTFTHQCRSCICNSDGSWNCSPQCPTYDVKCGANENVRNVREEVSSGCFCEKPTCVNRD